MTSILLVDDDALITEPLARRLQASGYKVSISHNGRDGLRMALDLQLTTLLLPVVITPIFYITTTTVHG